MANLFEKLKGIKTPKPLKPLFGDLLLKREPEYGKAMKFPVGVGITEPQIEQAEKALKPLGGFLLKDTISQKLKKKKEQIGKLSDVFYKGYKNIKSGFLQSLEKGYQPTGDELFEELDTIEKTKAVAKEFTYQFPRKLSNVTSGQISAVSGAIGYAERFGWDKAKPMADKLDEWAGKISVENPDKGTFDMVMSGLGSMSTFFIPGFGVARGTKLLAGVSPRIANIFGNSAMVFLESSMEAGGVYRDLKKQGYSEELAKRHADIDFGINVVLIGLTNRFNFVGNEKMSIIKEIKNRLLAGGREAVQELGQQVAGNIATYKNWDEGTKEAFGIGGLMGFIFGGSINPNIKIDTKQQKEILNIIKENAQKMPIGLTIKDVSGEGVSKEIKPLAKSEEAIMREIYNKEFASIKTESEQNLFRDVKDLGGLKTPQSLIEEMSDVPIDVKRTDGFTPDEIISELNEKGYNFQSGDELIEAIKEIRTMPSKFRVAEKPIEETMRILKTIKTKMPSDAKRIEKLEIMERKILREAKIKPIKPVKTIVREITEQAKPGMTEFKQRMTDLTRGAREGSIATREDILKSGDELKKTLKTLEVDPADAKWFNDTFKNIKGVEDLARKMPAIIARVDRLTNAREIRILKSEITEELKTAKPKIGIKKALESKLGPEVQKQMDFLRGTTKESIKLTSRTTEKGNIISGMNGNRIKALTKIEENINKYGVATDGVMSDVPFEITKQNALLNMIGIQDMSVAELRSTLSNIQSLKKTGQLEVLIKQSNKAAEIELLQDTAKIEFRSPKVKTEIVGVAEKEMNPVVKVINVIENAILGIRNISEKITFAKEFKVADWLGDTIRIARNGHNRIGIEWKNTKVKAFKSIFGEEKLGKIFQEMSKEQTIFKGEDALGKPVEMKLSQFEAAYWWGLARDPTNIPIFTKNMNFTPKMFKALDNFVNPKMKKYTDWLMDDWLKTIKKPINERYKVKFGMDMPENPNYLPRLYGDKIVEEEITNLLIGEAFPGHPSTIPSGVKTRIGSRNGFRRISIEQVMRRHSEQMNQFIHFDGVVSDARRVFMDTEVKQTILQSSGKPDYDTLIKKIDDIARGGMAAQMKLAGIDHFIGNFTQASLMFNWVPFMKQLTSFPAFTLGKEGITYKELLSGSMIYARHPVKWTKKFAESDFIFGRSTKGFNRETAIAFRQGDKDFTIKEVGMSLRDFLGKAAFTPTRGGDMVPILPGLTAKYIQTTNKLQRTTKLSAEDIHKKALAAAETLASRNQQSPWIEDVGRIQSANSVGKAISMYSTTPIQFLRESVGSVRMWNRGQVDTGIMLRTILTAWIILPQLFQYVSSGFEWDDDRQLRALLLGPLNYYPAAGNLMGTMYDAFAKGETWKGVASAISPLFSIPENAQQSALSLHRIFFKDVEDPTKEWARFAEKLYMVIALSTGKLPSTAPRTIKGIIDLSQGDTQDLRRIIYSEYALKEEEEEEEKEVKPIRGKSRYKNETRYKGKSRY